MKIRHKRLDGTHTCKIGWMCTLYALSCGCWKLDLKGMNPLVRVERQWQLSTTNSLFGCLFHAADRIFGSSDLKISTNSKFAFPSLLLVKNHESRTWCGFQWFSACCIHYGHFQRLSHSPHSLTLIKISFLIKLYIFNIHHGNLELFRNPQKNGEGGGGDC